MPLRMVDPSLHPCPRIEGLACRRAPQVAPSPLPPPHSPHRRWQVSNAHLPRKVNPPTASPPLLPPLPLHCRCLGPHHILRSNPSARSQRSSLAASSKSTSPISNGKI